MNVFDASGIAKEIDKKTRCTHHGHPDMHCKCPWNGTVVLYPYELLQKEITDAIEAAYKKGAEDRIAELREGK